MPSVVEDARLLRTFSGRRLRELVLDRTRDADLAHEVDVVSQVLPFKVSSYVADQLIDWKRYAESFEDFEQCECEGRQPICLGRVRNCDFVFQA